MLAAGNAQHAGAREAQQDAFGFSALDTEAIERRGALGVVCDGMGGHAGGAEASAAATRAFLAVFGTSDAGEPPTRTLQRALDAANEAVIDAGRRTGAADAGTTLAAALVRADALYWTSVGDTRIALVRGGRLFQVNVDHTFRRELLRRTAAGEGRRDDVAADPRRDHLTSSLGVSPIPEVDRAHRGLPLQPGDRVLVMTDGVHRALQPDELVGCMVDDPHRSCEAVLAAVLARQDPKQDNATIVAIDAPVVRSAAMPAGDRAGSADPSGAMPAATGTANDAAHRARTAARRRRLLGAGAIALAGVAALAYWLREGPSGGEPVPPAPMPAAAAPAPATAPGSAPADIRSRDLPPGGVAPPAERGGVPPRAGDRKATPP